MYSQAEERTNQSMSANRLAQRPYREPLPRAAGLHAVDRMGRLWTGSTTA